MAGPGPRLLFASDLHGATRAYAALFALARQREACDAVVLGGDLLPHPHDRARLVETQAEYAQDVLRPMLAALATDRPDLPVYAIPGNDDWATVIAALAGWSDTTLSLLVGRAVPLACAPGWWIAGCPYVPVTPFFMSDFDRLDHEGWAPAALPPALVLTEGGAVQVADIEALATRPTVAAELAALAAQSDPARTVYVTHSPPARTNLDVMRGGIHIGSEAVRAFIEAHRPPLTLHGHIHESPHLTGAVQERLGATVSVNAGASLGGLRAVEARLDLEAGTATVRPLFEAP
ncbi:MAG: metallophosphoesterase [Myxococcales bacterium]|nr:metallophosphoesterase [Myxococcales bacterium]